MTWPRISLFVAIVLSIGCMPPQGPQAVETRAVVANFQSRTGEMHYISCQIRLGWAESTLRALCGPPIAEYSRWADPNERCLAYESYAHSLAASHVSAPYIMVCVDEVEDTADTGGYHEDRMDSVEPSESDLTWRVMSVSGVSQLP